MGSGSTLAAAEAMGLFAIGAERFADYFEASKQVIPALTALKIPLEHWATDTTEALSSLAHSQIPLRLAVE